MFGLVEGELNREGLTMGALAQPKKLPTLGAIRTSDSAHARRPA